MCGICFNRTQFDVKKGFDELIGKYSVKNLNHRLHFLKGDAAALITDLAAKERIDLIIMGTDCRTSVAGFFIGNTVENVLQQVNCSVLTVKPNAARSGADSRIDDKRPL